MNEVGDIQLKEDKRENVKKLLSLTPVKAMRMRTKVTLAAL